MTTLLDKLNPVKAVTSEVKQIENKVKIEINTIGEYLLFGGTVLILLGVPFVNYVSSKVPELIDQTAKIASIIKPI